MMLIMILRILRCFTIIFNSNDGCQTDISEADTYLYKKLIHARHKNINHTGGTIQKNELETDEYNFIEIEQIVIDLPYSNNTIQNLLTIIKSDDVPFSENVNLEDVLCLFNLLEINDTEYCCRFYDKFVYLLIFKYPKKRINFSKILISEAMHRYVLSNFFKIIKKNFNFDFKDSICNIITKSQDFINFFFLLSEKFFIMEEYNLTLNSIDNNYYTDDFLKQVSSRVPCFSDIRIVTSPMFICFLKRLTLGEVFVINLKKLTLEIESNLNEEELLEIYKLANVRTLRINCEKYAPKSNGSSNSTKLSLPRLQNLESLIIEKFVGSEIDLSNVNNEKIKTFALVNSIYIDDLQLNPKLFPNIVNLTISLSKANYDVFLSELSEKLSRIKTLSSVAIRFFGIEFNSEDMSNFLEKKIFKTNIVACISDHKNSILIQENGFVANHNSFYEMVSILDYAIYEFYGVTKFPDFRKSVNFNLNSICFFNLTLSNFNFQNINIYTSVRMLILDDVVLNKYTCDSLGAMEFLEILSLENIIFEEPRCFYKILKRLKYSIKDITIVGTNIPAQFLLGLSECTRLEKLKIDQPIFKMNDFDMLFRSGFPYLKDLELINCKNISSKVLLRILQYKKFAILRLGFNNYHIRNVLKGVGFVTQVSKEYLIIHRF